MAESSRSWELFDGLSITSGIENAGVMEKLDIYLKLAQKCMEEVQGLSSLKFNNEQCGYLVDKLEATLHTASLFLEGSQVQSCGPYISMNSARQIKNFELLVTVAIHIESFVEGCSKDAWMQSALTLANVAEYVSSLGFNLELCRIALCNEQPTCGNLTMDEVGRISKTEVEIVEKKALIDVDSLMKSVTLELNSSNLEDQTLAKFLLHRLVGVQPKPTSNDENILFRLFEWVVSGKKSKQLGRGASATVYEVMWLGSPVAKKTFHGPENEEFLKEVEILSQLCHPNVTSMFCCHMNKRSCSIIMELMDGNLLDLIQGRLERSNDAPPFTMLEGIELMLQVGEGVNYLHNKRIVHRDLKSSNILIKSVEIPSLALGYVQAKVVDFGLSKTKEKSTTYSNMTYNTGTFRWMAPEVINIIKGNQESSKEGVKMLKHVFKVDIYSFAMVCFEILTGEVPFSCESVPRKIKEKILKGERPIIPDHCPLMLKCLIEKCWSQVPSERPDIGDVCLQLKYIKYLLMTSKVDEECNSLLKIEPFEVTYSVIENLRLVGQFQVRIYSRYLKELLIVPNGLEFIDGRNLFHKYVMLKERYQHCETVLGAHESPSCGDVGHYEEELKDIKHLLCFMDKEFAKVKIMYQDMESGGCATWQMLWAFFPPGEMVTYFEKLSNKEGIKRVFGRVLRTYYDDTHQCPMFFIVVMMEQEPKKQRWSTYVSNLIQQGKKSSNKNTHIVTVATFEGSRAFIELDIYPIRIRFGGMHKSPKLSMKPDESGKIMKEIGAFPNGDHKGIEKCLEHGKMTPGEINNRTKNFGNDFFIGKGRYAMVYHGRLQDGRDAAIKRLLPIGHLDTDILPEVARLSSLKHENVVELLGYCLDGGMPTLAYEYATMGSLSDILHGKGVVQDAQSSIVLDWTQRMKIAVDAAKGLQYFHETVNPPIIHQGIRSSNVLVFNSYSAKIDSFNFWETEPEMTLKKDLLYYAPRLVLSYSKGFVAPEYALTKESDVYNFGVVLLELLTGQRCWDPTLPHGKRSLVFRATLWADDKVLNDPKSIIEFIDPKLGSSYPLVAAEKMAVVIALCLQTEADFRPKMSIVVKALQNVLQTRPSPKT